MEENNVENKEINKTQNNKGQNSQKQIMSAIIVAGVLIAGAILLKDSKAPTINPNIQDGGVPVTSLAPVTAEDKWLGSPAAKVTLVMYEDYQCPFCGKFFKESEEPIRNSYVFNEQVKIVYRDFAFLGPESQKAAEATRCANDQERFWEYHDYLFNHQNGENEGAFADPNLKSFAKELGLNSTEFDSCLDSGKHAQAVLDARDEATRAGVSGTPKGFILKDGKVVSTIDGAEPYGTVKAKIDAALK